MRIPGLLLLCLCTVAFAEEPTLSMSLAVDARDLPERGLLRAAMTIPASGSSMTVRWPEWIPGTHAPSGPVHNLGGFAVRDDRGAHAAWERDSLDPYRFRIAVPEGAATLAIELTYIANAPTVNSQGVDIIGLADLGVINWNCCVVVPDGVATARIACSTELTLPAGWAWAGALREARRGGDTVAFAPLPLDRLIDNPVLIAKSIDRFRLHAENAAGPEAMLHIAAPAGIERLRDERWVVSLRALHDQALALFGGAWYGRYDFLVLLGIEPTGIEHAECSLSSMGMGSADFANADRWQREILAHEFVHSWVGKYRRPLGMLTGDFATVPIQDSLWIYEGLTEHLGRVLAVRSGLTTAAEWRSAVAQDVDALGSLAGRRWRSLRDTCRASHQLRVSEGPHADLRRGQDYYLEGALFWLAADLRIRAASDSREDLDGFCRSFFGPQGERAAGYDEAQVSAALERISPGDWAGAIHRWIDGTGDLDTSFLDGSGWRMSREPVRPGEVDPAEVDPVAVGSVIGLVLGDGWVTQVLPGSPAALSGLQAGDFVHAINRVELEKDPLALAKAVIASPQAPEIVLYACRNRDEWTNRVVRYDKGIRLARLVRVPGQDDAFAPLLAPRHREPVPIAP